jgi:hypothetical protein
MTYFEGVSSTGLVSHTDIDAHLAPDATSILLDLTTGERVPHWVELDATAPTPEERLLMVRPAVPYEWGHHYVMAFRGLQKGDGSSVDVSDAFRTLRDGEATDDPDVGHRRALYEETLFPALEAEGFARADLQLAWDFRTASRDNTLGPLLHMRDDAFANLPSEGIGYTITNVEDRECSEDEVTARIVEGTFTSPYYTEEDRPGAFLSVGDDGLPVVMGNREVPFLMRIPCSVAFGPDGNGPVAGSAPILQYGHGLLGGREEAGAGYLNRMANDAGYILLAQNWTGFAGVDVPGISLMLALNIEDFGFISERSAQGMIEFAYGMRMATTSIVDDPAFQFDGVSVIDPEARYYYGNSQGGIMGAAYLALAPDVQRGVFGVGGAPYSLLLPRSVDFDPFLTILRDKYPDHRNIMFFVAGMTQQLWDPTEGGGWLWDMVRDAEEPKQVLMQVAIYDNQVSTLAAHIQARAYGARTIAPQTRPIWGVEEVEATESAPWTGSAIVEWRYDDLPDEPVEPIPPGSAPPAGFEGRGLDPHECPRREPAAQLQLRRFLETGEVVQFCDGPCVGLKEVTCP